MRKLKYFAILMLLVGCSTTNNIKRLLEPAELPLNAGGYSSFIPEGNREASIGDELFSIARFNTSKSSDVRIVALTGNPFPKGASWMGTHSYTSRNGSEYTVFTSPEYYNGIIGIMLDKEYNVFPEISLPNSDYSLVRVEGRRADKLYQTRGRGKFIEGSSQLIDYWGLRYGGLKNGEYVFDIVNKSESNIGEILQSILVTQDSFSDGFTVRGVLIQGIQQDSRGIIMYNVTDLYNN